MGIVSFCISNEVIKQKEEERLAKERAEQERQKIAYRKALEACCTFVTEVVVPNIDNINLRQNVQCKVRDVVSWITASFS